MQIMVTTSTDRLEFWELGWPRQIAPPYESTDLFWYFHPASMPPIFLEKWEETLQGHFIRRLPVGVPSGRSRTAHLGSKTA
jgi:hypothetical protein